MQVKLILPIVFSLALFAELASAIPAMADEPVPTPHATAAAGVVWGGGGREDDSSKKKTTGSGTHSGKSQRKTHDTNDLANLMRQCQRLNNLHIGAFIRTICDLPTSAITPVHSPPLESQLRTVAAQLKLPDPTPRFGPDPSVNEWKMLAVGFPIWLWTDRPTTVSTTTHHDGLDFTLTATWTSTTFTMGDGNTKTCTATTIRPKTVKPATKPSPTCSYTYQTKSKIGHPYTVTADTHWRIDWTTNGHQGTFNHTYTGNRTLTIGELQSLING